MRYERKYRIENIEYQQVYQKIMSIAGAFRKSYGDRWVNSIYLDDLDFNALNDNLSGISNRFKYRLRWYGDSLEELKKPILEKKIKENMLGYKELFQMDSFINTPRGLRESLSIRQLQEKSAVPVVLIKYLRTYLQSFDNRVRITIDRSLNYFGINNYSIDPFPIQDEAIILEVKYDEEIEEDISDILQAIPFRMTKNSKYCSGMLEYWE
ncbi:MAG: polyphosphate polymerase domain-containing protein [Bacteroidota bacterium]